VAPSDEENVAKVRALVPHGTCKLNEFENVKTALYQTGVFC
jgi:hypothetical protein